MIHKNSNLADPKNGDADMRVRREMLREIEKMEKFFSVSNKKQWFSSNPEEVASVINHKLKHIKD